MKIEIKIIALVIFLSVISCERPNVITKDTGIRYGNIGFDLQEIVIDSCQYIGKFNGSNHDWGSHKGNCSNPIHKK
jgi:hypothetical protein